MVPLLQCIELPFNHHLATVSACRISFLERLSICIGRQFALFDIKAALIEIGCNSGKEVITVASANGRHTPTGVLGGEDGVPIGNRLRPRSRPRPGPNTIRSLAY